MESSIFSSAICNERKYIPGRRRKWKAMKATKWNKVKKFETWRSWTFFCSLSRVSAHECFKSFCRLPRRDREVVNRLTCFFDMKSKKKNLNDLFQKCGVSVVRQQSRFYQDDVVNSNKKIFKATIWKEHQHHIFYYNLMNCCHLQNSCFFAKSSCKKTTQMQRKSGKSNMQTLIHKNLILSFVCSVQASLQYLSLPNFA